MPDLKENPCTLCRLLSVLGRVEVFLNSTISPLVLSCVFGVLLLYDKLRFPLDSIQILRRNVKTETERKISEGFVARRIGPRSMEK